MWSFFTFCWYDIYTWVVVYTHTLYNVYLLNLSLWGVEKLMLLQLFHCRYHDTGDKLSPLLPVINNHRCRNIILSSMSWSWWKSETKLNHGCQQFTDKNLSPVTTIPVIIYRRYHWHRNSLLQVSLTPAIKTKLQISPRIFVKYAMPFWGTQGHTGNGFTKKFEVENSGILLSY